ncbi:MAG: hypothetical protein ACOCTT_01845, partial [archaeon]
IKEIADRVPKRKVTKKKKIKTVDPNTLKEKEEEVEVVDEENARKMEKDYEDAMRQAFDSGELDRKKAQEDLRRFMNR